MRLSDLEATFIGRYAMHDESGKRQDSFHHLPTADGAQGVLFICPKCQNHSILAWFNNPRNAPPVPADAFPKPGRWTFTGETMDTLTLTPSVDLSKIDAEHPSSPCRCYWHGFVTNGDAA